MSFARPGRSRSCAARACCVAGTQLAGFRRLKGQCLNKASVDHLKQSVGGHWDMESAPLRNAVLGRVVGGRLTLEGGLAPAPEQQEDGGNDAAPAVGWVGVRDAELPGMPGDGWPEQFAGPLTHRRDPEHSRKEQDAQHVQRLHDLTMLRGGSG